MLYSTGRTHKPMLGDGMQDCGLELRMAWTNGFQTLFGWYLADIYRILIYNFKTLAGVIFFSKVCRAGTCPLRHLALPWHHRLLCTEDNLEHSLKVTNF